MPWKGKSEACHQLNQTVLSRQMPGKKGFLITSNRSSISVTGGHVDTHIAGEGAIVEDAWLTLQVNRLRNKRLSSCAGTRHGT
ncbi:hypothetical protein CDAR_43381 [Caerostris darwini]|uniref:Uncharacterized protein n=1 Tax=Caerostris darwini TaxID=1538125 RepID=A0AAV4WGD8_9ARAC|nr:hypothetical protein CDAR_43381 [Caerostris darwini]